MLVPLPIGLLVAAFLADIGGLATSDPFWGRAALWLITGGVGFAILAAIFGLIDFVAIAEARRHAVGWVHVVGNLGAVALAIVNLAVRWWNMVPDWIGLILSAVTVLILVVTGWAGGELAYRYRIGVMAAGPPDPAASGGHAAHREAAE